MSRLHVLCNGIVLLVLSLSPVEVGFADDDKPAFLRAGLIGLDTSHVTAFTSILNDPKNLDKFGVKIVAGFPGGSPDLPDSANRIDGFTKTLKEKYKVEIVDSIEDLLKKVDVVFLESVDGRPHLKQAIPVLKAGKKLFIDKPMAASLADVLMIFQLAAQHKTPVFSSSSLRYGSAIAGIRKNPKKIGNVVGCFTYGPCPLEKTHPDLFWYGIHGVETLFTVMGTGCQSVTRTHTKGADVVTGAWNDGRIGTFRGVRDGSASYGAVVFGGKGVYTAPGSGDYKALMEEACQFFKTGKAPVSAEETIEIFAFMEAADESKRNGGAVVTLESVVRKAKEKIGAP